MGASADTTSAASHSLPSEGSMPQHLAAVALAGLVVTASTLAAQQPGGTRITVGAGVVSLAAYPGSDDRRVLPVPVIAIEAGRFFVGGGSGATGGAGVHLIRSRGLSLTAEVGGTLNRPASTSDDLRGFTDRGFGTTAGSTLRVQAGPLALGLSGATGLDRDVGSFARASLGVQHAVDARGRLRFAWTASATLANARHMAWDFGISADDALGSGRSGFAPRGGLRDVSLGVSPMLAVGTRWQLAGFATVGRLGDRAAASPLVQRRTWVDLGIALVRPL